MHSQPVQASEPHEWSASTQENNRQVIPQLAAHQQVDDLAPSLQGACRLGVHHDVLKPRHGHFNRRLVRGVDTPGEHIGSVFLPAVVRWHINWFLLAAHFFHTRPHVVV